MLYPELFSKPKDEYMKILMLEMLDNFSEKPKEEQLEEEILEEEVPTGIVSYIGNVHVSPLSKIWNPLTDA